MPLYEYRCERCGARVEALQKVADPPLSTCSACGGRLERLLSAPALQFKGAGWYVTDYARKGAKPAGSSEAGSSPGGEKAATTAEKTGSDGAPAAASAAEKTT